jgi:hypothetical protein
MPDVTIRESQEFRCFGPKCNLRFPYKDIAAAMPLNELEFPRGIEVIKKN